jgi:hypothetical protein
MEETDWFARGEVAKRVYEALRTGNSVSPTELADDAIKAKEWGNVGWQARRGIIAKFSSILYTTTRRGQLVKIGRGVGVRWKLAPTEPELI